MAATTATTKRTQAQRRSSFTSLLVLCIALLAAPARSTPYNSLEHRPSGQNGYFVCLPGQGFCCAAVHSGYLFPAVQNNMCASMAVCLANGTILFDETFQGFYQDKDCTQTVDTTAQVPNCTGYIQTIQVNLAENYFAAPSAAGAAPRAALLAAATGLLVWALLAFLA